MLDFGGVNCPTSISCFGSSINIWSAASHLLPFANALSLDVATRSIRKAQIFSAGVFPRENGVQRKLFGEIGAEKIPKEFWLSTQIHSSIFTWKSELVDLGCLLVCALWHCVINLALKHRLAARLLTPGPDSGWAESSKSQVLPFHLSQDTPLGWRASVSSTKKTSSHYPWSISQTPSIAFASTQTFHLSKLAPQLSLKTASFTYTENLQQNHIGKPGMPKGIALVAAYNGICVLIAPGLN